MRLSHRAIVPFAAAVVFACLLGTRATADDVTTSGGKKTNGKLVAADAQGVTLATDNAKATIPNREIVVVDFGNKVAQFKESFSEIELTDGSTIKVAKFLAKEKKFESDLLPPPMGLTAPTFDIPLSSVFSVMKKADDQKQRDAWKKMLATRGKRDLYVIARDGGLTYLQGTILAGGQNSDGTWILKFEPESGGATEELLQSRCAGLVFYHAQPATIAPTLCRVLDVYGNSLNATAITLASDGSVIVNTVAGATIKYPSTASLSKFDYALGNVAYISDLVPQIDRPEIPQDEMKLNPTVAFLKDRSLSNDAIKLENVIYQKGLCIAPDTVLTYNLGGDYSQFKATAGIDENGANATSSAKLTIEADGQVLFTGTLTRKDKPKGLVLAVKGVKQLKIIVEAETPLNGNYVTLAEAHVQK
jgi:hypothetical protein